MSDIVATTILKSTDSIKSLEPIEFQYAHDENTRLVTEPLLISKNQMILRHSCLENLRDVAATKDMLYFLTTETTWDNIINDSFRSISPVTVQTRFDFNNNIKSVLSRVISNNEKTQILRLQTPEFFYAYIQALSPSQDPLGALYFTKSLTLEFSSINKTLVKFTKTKNGKIALNVSLPGLQTREFAYQIVIDTTTPIHKVKAVSINQIANPNYISEFAIDLSEKDSQFQFTISYEQLALKNWTQFEVLNLQSKVISPAQYTERQLGINDNGTSLVVNGVSHSYTDLAFVNKYSGNVNTFQSATFLLRFDSYEEFFTGIEKDKQNTWVGYYNEIFDKTNNRNVKPNPAFTTSRVPTNYLLTCNFRQTLNKDNNTAKINILPLKNSYTPDYETIKTPTINYNNQAVLSPENRFQALQRQYTKIFANNFSDKEYDKINLGYSSSTKNLTLEADQNTFFHFPLQSTEVPLSESGLIRSGALPGPTPFSSDKIFAKNTAYGYKNYWGTSTPPIECPNGAFLCSWLSGQGGSNLKDLETSVWMDRWYDSANVAEISALTSSVNVLSSNEQGFIIYDEPSKMKLQPGGYYYYHHIGNKTLTSFIDTFNIGTTGLRLNIQGEPGTIRDQSNYKASVTIANSGPNTIVIDNPDELIQDNYTLNLDGTNYATVQYAQHLDPSENITVAAWINSDTWCENTGYHIIDNGFRSGWNFSIFNNYYNPTLCVSEGNYSQSINYSDKLISISNNQGLSYISNAKFNGKQKIKSVSNIDFRDYATLTFSIWFKTNVNTTQFLFGNRNKDYDSGKKVVITNNQKIIIYSNDEELETSSLVWQPNNWYHLVVVFSPTTRKIYLNSSLLATSSGGSDQYIGRSSFAIGGEDPLVGTTNLFDGELRDFIMWDKELTQTEITNIFNGENIDLLSSKPVQYWPLEHSLNSYYELNDTLVPADTEPPTFTQIKLTSRTQLPRPLTKIRVQQDNTVIVEELFTFVFDKSTKTLNKFDYTGDLIDILDFSDYANSIQSSRLKIGPDNLLYLLFNKSFLQIDQNFTSVITIENNFNYTNFIIDLNGNIIPGDFIDGNVDNFNNVWYISSCPGSFFTTYEQPYINIPFFSSESFVGPIDQTMEQAITSTGSTNFVFNGKSTPSGVIDIQPMAVVDLNDVLITFPVFFANNPNNNIQSKFFNPTKLIFDKANHLYILNDTHEAYKFVIQQDRLAGLLARKGLTSPTLTTGLNLFAFDEDLKKRIQAANGIIKDYKGFEYFKLTSTETIWPDVSGLYGRQNTGELMYEYDSTRQQFRTFLYYIDNFTDTILRFNSNLEFKSLEFLQEGFDIGVNRLIDIEKTFYTNIATSYDWYRKYSENKCGLIRLKIYTRFQNQITETTLNTNEYSLIDQEWHHIAFTFESRTGKIILYLDGVPVDIKTIKPNSQIYYDYENNIGIGTSVLRSGTLQEELKTDSYIFNGKIDDIRIYDHVLTQGNIGKLILNKFKIHDIQWDIPTSPKSYIEEVQHFYMHKQPGSKSSLFDIQLINTGIQNEQLQSLISTKIREAIDRLKPGYTKLNKILWK